MRKKALVILAPVVGFIWGAACVKYNVFPYSLYSAIKARPATASGHAPAPPLKTPPVNVEPSAVLRVTSVHEIEKRRRLLNRLVFGRDALPHDIEPTVEKNVTDLRLPASRQTDRFTVRFAEGITSTAYLLHAPEHSRSLVILHGGHDVEWLADRYSIPARELLAAGHDVLLLQMPLYGWNNRPTVTLASGDPVVLHHHDQLGHFKKPLRFFLEPVARSLNYALRTGKYEKVAMAGISGGGWTATVYAALDTRIQLVFAVAGSLPLYLRAAQENDHGDFEQNMPALMNIANYLDLYVMGAHGKHYWQINVNRDPCCFGGGRHLTYAATVQRAVGMTGSGVFEAVDDPYDEHGISPSTTRRILAALR